MGSRDFTLKGRHKISHNLSPSTEALVLREPGSNPLANISELPGEAGGNSGDKDSSNSHFSVSHISRLHYHKDTSVGKCKVPF